MRINKKKFIYLISPNKIRNSIYNELSEILKLGKVSFFQLRLKNSNFKDKLIIGRKIQKICKRYKTKFIINDDVALAKKLNADGCHLGQNDMRLIHARKIIKKKIIGITCHNSIRLAKLAIKDKADYVAFGAFFKTTTKIPKSHAKLEILKWWCQDTTVPAVAIGGINMNNCRTIIETGVDFLAISSALKSVSIKTFAAAKA